MSRHDKIKLIKHYIIVFLFFAVGLILDQWSKYLAVTRLKESGTRTYVLSEKILQFTYVENKGAAWGIGQGKAFAFSILGLFIIALIIYMYVRIPFKKRYIPMRICFVLLVCGAVGNMIDRIRLGYVVDFFDVNFIDFPVFNIADIYVVCSVIMIILFGLFFYKEEDFNIFTRKTKISENEVL